MANNTITQKIALEGGPEFKLALAALGPAGEAAFKRIGDATKGVSESLKKVGEAVDSLALRFGVGGLALGELGRKLSQFVKAAAESGDTIGDNASKVGLSVTEYQKLTDVAATAGLGANELVRGLGRLQQQLSTNADLTRQLAGSLAPVADAAARAAVGFGEAGVTVHRAGEDFSDSGVHVTNFGSALDGVNDKTLTAAQVLAKLRVNTRDANGALLPISELLPRIADAFVKLPDGAVKTAAGLDLARRFGENLIPFLNQGGDKIRELSKRFDELGAIQPPAVIQALGDLNDEFDIAGIAAKGLRNQVVALFAPAIIEGIRGVEALFVANRAAIIDFATVLRDDVVQGARDFVASFKPGELQAGIRRFVLGLRDLGTAAITTFRDVLIPLAGKVSDGLDSLAGAINALFGTQISGKQLGITLALTQLLGINGAVLSGVGLLVSSLQLAVTVIGGLGQAVLSSRILIGLGFIAAADLIISNFERVKTFVNDVGSGIGKLLAGNIQGGLSSLKDTFTKALGDLKGASLRTWAEIALAAPVAFKVVTAAFSTAVEFIIGLLSGLQIADKLIPAAAITLALAGLVKLFADNTGRIKEFFNDLGGAIKKALTGDFSGSLQEFNTTFVKAFQDLKEQSLATLAELGIGVVAAIRVITAALGTSGPLGLAILALALLLGGLVLYWPEISKAADTAAAVIEEKLGKAWQFIKDTFGTIKDFFTGIWGDAVKATTDAANAIGGAFDKVTGTISDAFKSVGNAITDALRGAEQFIDGLTAKVNAIRDAISSVLPKIGTSGTAGTARSTSGAAKVADIAVADPTGAGNSSLANDLRPSTNIEDRRNFDALQSSVGAATEAVNAFASALTGALKNVGDGVKSAGREIRDVTAEAFGPTPALDGVAAPLLSNSTSGEKVVSVDPPSVQKVASATGDAVAHAVKGAILVPATDSKVSAPTGGQVVHLDPPSVEAVTKKATVPAALDGETKVQQAARLSGQLLEAIKQIPDAFRKAQIEKQLSADTARVNGSPAPAITGIQAGNVDQLDALARAVARINNVAFGSGPSDVVSKAGIGTPSQIEDALNAQVAKQANPIGAAAQDTKDALTRLNDPASKAATALQRLGEALSGPAATISDIVKGVGSQLSTLGQRAAASFQSGAKGAGLERPTISVATPAASPLITNNIATINSSFLSLRNTASSTLSSIKGDFLSIGAPASQAVQSIIDKTKEITTTVVKTGEDIVRTFTPETFDKFKDKASEVGQALPRAFDPKTFKDFKDQISTKPVDDIGASADTSRNKVSDLAKSLRDLLADLTGLGSGKKIDVDTSAAEAAIKRLQEQAGAPNAGGEATPFAGLPATTAPGSAARLNGLDGLGQSFDRFADRALAAITRISDALEKALTSVGSNGNLTRDLRPSTNIEDRRGAAPEPDLSGLPPLNADIVQFAQTFRTEIDATASSLARVPASVSPLVDVVSRLIPATQSQADASQKAARTVEDLGTTADQTEKELVPFKELVPSRPLTPQNELVPFKELVPNKELVPFKDLVPDGELVPFKELAPNVDKLSTAASDATTSFSDVKTSATSLSTAFHQIIDATRGISSDSSSGGDNIEGFAVGGHIRGPGTATSDSILARLSDGEFVQKTSAVRHYGVNVMHAINRMEIPARVLRTFAAGGPVSALRSLVPTSVQSRASEGEPQFAPATTGGVVSLGQIVHGIAAISDKGVAPERTTPLSSIRNVHSTKNVEDRRTAISAQQITTALNDRTGDAASVVVKLLTAKPEMISAGARSFVESLKTILQTVRQEVRTVLFAGHVPTTLTKLTGDNPQMLPDGGFTGGPKETVRALQQAAQAIQRTQAAPLPLATKLAGVLRTFAMGGPVNSGASLRSLVPTSTQSRASEGAHQPAPVPAIIVSLGQMVQRGLAAISGNSGEADRAASLPAPVDTTHSAQYETRTSDSQSVRNVHSTTNIENRRTALSAAQQITTALHHRLRDAAPVLVNLLTAKREVTSARAQSFVESLKTTFQSLREDVRTVLFGGQVPQTVTKSTGDTSPMLSGGGLTRSLRETGRTLQHAAQALQTIQVGPLPSSAKLAGGGHIIGPGTATSDSIPALLSDGEFVQRTAAVRHYGVDFMHAINQLRIPVDHVRAFATGGVATLRDSLDQDDLPRFAGGGEVAASVRSPGISWLGTLREIVQVPAFASGGLVSLRETFQNIMPAFAHGGAVQALQSAFQMPDVSVMAPQPAFASAGGGLHPVNLHFGNGTTVKGLFAPANVVGGLKKEAAASRIASTGKAPRWS